MQKITPFLWFNTNAEEAVTFYVSVFKNSQVNSITRYGEGGPMPAGSAMTLGFTLDGCSFGAINGGPMFSFTPATSFVISCSNQEEVDYYWERLCEGGQEGQCGWLTDKFGLSWQVVPQNIKELLDSSDRVRAARVLAALMPMKKLDITTLRKAYDG